MNEKRSPVKEPPLRNPGQSAGERADDLVHEDASAWIATACLAFLFALIEWVRWLLKAPLMPIAVSIGAGIVIGLAWFKIRSLRPLIRQYRQGGEGEKAVGQLLENLRKQDYHVFHDIPSERGNVDHVLIGPGGIFVIETKTNSKPTGTQPKIIYDGRQVTIDGKVPERDPVAQVHAATAQISDLIERGLGKSIPIRPVLLYVGWYVEPMPKRSDIWVINQRALMKLIRNSYKRLSPEDVRLGAMCLEMHIRSKAAGQDRQ